MATDEELPPIVHPAGHIPPEVVRTIREQIEAKFIAELAAAQAYRIVAPSRDEVLARFQQDIAALHRTEPAKPIEVTRDQWEALKAAYPPPPQQFGLGGELSHLVGVPVVVVEPGWLQRTVRWLTRAWKAMFR